MARHLLVLEGLARILAVAGGAVRAVADRNAVRRLEAGEVPPLHRAGKTLALADAGDIDLLARDEMRAAQRRAEVERRIGTHPELDELQRRLDAGLGEVAAVRAGHVLRLGPADADLEGVVAILLGVTAGDNTHLVQM